MKFFAIALAAVLILAATCSAQDDEFFAARKSLTEKAKEKLAEITQKTTKKIDEVLVKVKKESQKVVTKIEDATKKSVNAVDKAITAELNVIAKLAKQAQSKGFDSGKCVEKPTKELNKKKTAFTNGVWLCNKDGIGFITITVDNGVKDMQSINADIKKLGKELDACKTGSWCLTKFIGKLVLKQPKFIKKINAFLSDSTEIMTKTLNNFVTCQTNVQTSFLEEGLKLTGDMTKCLKDLIA